MPGIESSETRLEPGPAWLEELYSQYSQTPASHYSPLLKPHREAQDQ